MTPMDAPLSGPPAPTPIFIHGSGGDHRVWTHQSECFAGGAFVDLPGHPRGVAVPDAAELAGALAGALDQAERPGVLVGHSLGGALALQVARMRPDLVEGVVAISSGARLPVPEWVMESLLGDFDAECRRLLEGFFTAPERDGPSRAAVADALAECGPATLEADYRACRSVDLRGELDELRVPVLVIVGSDDPLTPPWLSEELARELPMAEMVVIDGVRHMAMVEAPATVNLLIGAFLARAELGG
jgi:pimeloyl-ACP methyl ester carboxylesterase